MRLRCRRRSTARPQTEGYLHIASHNSSAFVRSNMDNVCTTLVTSYKCERTLTTDPATDNERLRHVQTRIKWIEGVSFSCESGSGHAVVLDGAPEYGGRNLGMRPMEMLLTGMAACTAFDVVLILMKGRAPLADCVVTAAAERAPDDPKVFRKIHLVYTVAGRGLDPKQVERAVTLSKEKYCSATIMLAKTAEVTYEIVMVDGDRVPLPAP